MASVRFLVNYSYCDTAGDEYYIRAGDVIDLHFPPYRARCRELPCLGCLGDSVLIRACPKDLIRRKVVEVV